MTENPKQFIVHYLKTPNYRTFHVDGAFGGITPTGSVYMELFLQRWPTPKSIVSEVNADGTPGKEICRDSKEGLIREIEAGMVMDLAAAEVIYNWLGDKIRVLKQINQEEKK